MKLTLSPFSSDHLHISRWELIKLFFGFTLTATALNVSTKPKPKK